MNQAQKAPEPGVEDLLASIRKAITEESAARPGAASGTTGTDGSPRLSPDDRIKPDRPHSEILELRNRIAGQLAERTPSSPRPSAFAGILSGDAGLPPVSAAPLEPPRLKTEERPRIAPPILRQAYEALESEPAAAALPVEDHPYGEERVGAAPGQGEYPAEDQDSYRREDHDPQPPPRQSRSAREPAYAPPSLPQPERYRTPLRDPGILSPEAAAGAEAAFSRLADSIMSRAIGERPIEDITRELLRSMLKQWLDEHLPALVERLVREEIERVARRGGR